MTVCHFCCTSQEASDHSLLGRADIIIFDDNGGASGFLNVRGKLEGYPVWQKQEVILGPTGEDWRSLRLVSRFLGTSYSFVAVVSALRNTTSQLSCGTKLEDLEPSAYYRGPPKSECRLLLSFVDSEFYLGRLDQ